MIPRPIAAAWPLLAAVAAAAMLAVAHAFETFGHLVPCELCLKQREVYWAAVGVGVAGWALSLAARGRPVARYVSLLVGLIFLLEAGLAAYHAGVEWKWWPGPQSCTGAGRADVRDLTALLQGAKIGRPNCDVAAWRMAGLSMAGWNALAALGLAVLSGAVFLRKETPDAA